MRTPLRAASRLTVPPVVAAFPILMAISYVAWIVDRPPSLRPLSLGTWLLLCVAGAISPAIVFELGRRMSSFAPLIGGLSWRTAAAHAAAMVASALADIAARAIVIPRSPIPVAPHSAPDLIANAALSYLLVALGCQAVRTARGAQLAEMMRARLRADVDEALRRRADAELRALKAELNPHFLGNALQGVKALMRTDLAAAERALVPLADVLRTALTRCATQETTLADELEALQPFIDLERASLRGRLDVTFDVADDTRDALVPDMILQPLVENAAKHGLIPFGGGRIRISARRAGGALSGEGEVLVLTVEDDGVALGAVGTTRASTSGGVGLANVRARLAELYSDRARLELARDGLGTAARITLPLRKVDASTAQLLGDSGDSTVDTPRTMGVRTVPFSRDSWLGRARRIASMGATIGIWFICAAMSASSDARVAAMKGYGDKTLYSIVDAIVVATVLTVTMYAAFALSRRMPMTAPRYRSRFGVLRVILASAAAGAVAGLVLCIAKIVVAGVFGYSELLQLSHLRHNVPRSTLSLDFLFLILCGVGQAYNEIAQLQVSTRQRGELRTQLEDVRRHGAQAELRALKSELNPHFIGNALNAVAALMRTDTVAAAGLLDDLSDLLRTAVDRSATQEVTLREELASLQPFLSVERVRLGRLLDLTVDADERTLDGSVPHMILQPLVENAVKHGFAQRTEGRIEVHAHHDARQLEVTIRDDGAGMVDVATHGRSGVGLANARARLSRLYGQSASIELSAEPRGGTVARLVVPWRGIDVPATAARRRPASVVDAAGSP